MANSLLHPSYCFHWMVHFGVSSEGVKVVLNKFYNIFHGMHIFLSIYVALTHTIHTRIRSGQEICFVILAWV